MTTKWTMVLAAFLHVVGVASYLGGSIVMELVLAPAQKFIPPAQAQVMGQKSGDRFLLVAWGALGLIAASGVLRLFTLSNEGILTSYEGGYGKTLLVMIVLWLVLVANGSIMTFVLRPKLTGRASGAPAAGQMQARQNEMLKAATWVNRITKIDLGVALAIALLGSSLGFGGIF